MLKFAVALAVTAAALAAIQAVSSTDQRPAKVRTHRAYKAALGESLQVITGTPRTVSDNPDWDDQSDADSVQLDCPVGTRAVSGGFEAPDSAAVLLSGSHPGDTPQQWVIEVLYMGDGTPTTWIPNVTCA